MGAEEQFSPCLKETRIEKKLTFSAESCRTLETLCSLFSYSCYYS